MLFINACVEDAGDGRVIHDRERLALVVETREDLSGIHAELDHLERDLADERVSLFSEMDGTHAAFSEDADEFVLGEVLLWWLGVVLIRSKSSGEKAGGTEALRVSWLEGQAALGTLHLIIVWAKFIFWKEHRRGSGVRFRLQRGLLRCRQFLRG